MIRNLKVMGLTLIALLAMSAFVASSASAEFESEAESTTLTASSNDMQKFSPTAGGIAVECTTVGTENTTVSGKSATTITSQAVYSNCEPFLGVETAVNMNGCQYRFELGHGTRTGNVDVLCPSGKTIEIIVGTICKYTIGGFDKPEPEPDLNQNLSHIVYANSGAGSTREVTLEPNVTGITSVRATNHFFCPAAGTSGTYVGDLTVTGESGGSHVGVFVE